MKEEIYDIGEMHCAACSSAVERVTRKLAGVERSDVNLTMKRMNIVYDESQTTPEMIIKKVEKAGFTCTPHAEEKKAEKTLDSSEKELKIQRIELIIMAISSAILLYISMGSMLVANLPIPTIISMTAYPVNFAITQLVLASVIVFLGRKFFVSGFKSLFNGSPNMDALVAISSTASFLYSLVMTYLITDDPMRAHDLYFESAAVVLTLISLGKLLEKNSEAKTKGAITALMELSPDTAILVNSDGQWEVFTDTLKVGDIVLVKAGTRFPMDGRVTRGEGSVDESMLTGESLPLEKSVGSQVIGGSIAVSGAIYVEIMKVGADTTLSKIIKFVEDAQGKKAPISKVADRVAGIFVPIVIVISLLSAVIWVIVGQEISFALKIFTTVLVIACPCAMGLATPTAIIVGTGKGAANGILIRSGEALEHAHKTDVVILDKTGTITEGKPRVTEIFALNMTENELLSLAASAESLSDHPLAKAICETAHDRELSFESLSGSFEVVQGLGLRAEFEGKTLVIGNNRLMAEENVAVTELESQISELSSQGKTPMLVALGGVFLGLIAVSDTVKKTSREAIEKLREMGVETVILTGDNVRAAKYIATLVGADRVIGEVLPQDKAAVVKEYQDRGKKVMMVGDGINDAPALAQADVGCAIGNGSDIAIESADIVLMKSDLNDVPKAIKLSRLTIKNIKQNLFWAFSYNVLCIPIAAGVLYPSLGLLLSPMVGGIAMSLSSLFVLGNALRLRGKKI